MFSAVTWVTWVVLWHAWTATNHLWAAGLPLREQAGDNTTQFSSVPTIATPRLRMHRGDWDLGAQRSLSPGLQWRTSPADHRCSSADPHLSQTTDLFVRHIQTGPVTSVVAMLLTRHVLYPQLDLTRRILEAIARFNIYSEENVFTFVSLTLLT